MESEELPRIIPLVTPEQAQHSISCYGLNGEHLETQLDKQDLLGVLTRMNRVLVDTNSLGELRQARLPENANRAFILGQTVEDEVENLSALLFGNNVDNSNSNLFDFSLVAAGKIRGMIFPFSFLIISRLDCHYRLVFDGKRLRRESRPRASRSEPEFIERERERMRRVEGLKTAILEEVMPWPRTRSLPLDQAVEMKSQLVERIRARALECRRNYGAATLVASQCYGALLLEQDEIGEKTRKEFFEPNRRNVFGDTQLIADALWLDASILSKDNAVRRMAEYLNLPSITVTFPVQQG